MVLSLFPSHPVLREERVPILAPASNVIRVLHISDLHLTVRERKNIEWLRSLNELQPDFVISTGDHLAARNSVPLVYQALDGLLNLPGFFVLGSNDYFAPKPKSPHHYLKRAAGAIDSGAGHSTASFRELPWRELVSGLEKRGWIDLTHTRTRINVHGLDIELRGTDDAHLGRDDYRQVAGPSSAALSIGVTHAPYARLLQAMDADHIDLIFAGHTHGGQWRLPWPGGSRALVTNCDLPPRQARGLSRAGSAWLNVSAGVGASPYAPLRIACPPEASLLTLVPRE